MNFRLEKYSKLQLFRDGWVRELQSIIPFGKFQWFLGTSYLQIENRFICHIVEVLQNSTKTFVRY